MGNVIAVANNPKTEKDMYIDNLKKQGYTPLNLTHFKDRKVPPEVWYNFETKQFDIINWDELDSKTQEEVKTALGNLFTLN